MVHQVNLCHKILFNAGVSYAMGSAAYVGANRPAVRQESQTGKPAAEAARYCFGFRHG